MTTVCKRGKTAAIKNVMYQKFHNTRTEFLNFLFWELCAVIGLRRPFSQWLTMNEVRGVTRSVTVKSLTESSGSRKNGSAALLGWMPREPAKIF